ncbi:MAG TPA: hypothetical protein VD794_12685 [Flavisolibacter sp.]|nr:hypothetical protein [Flavisolibacter sp.]
MPLTNEPATTSRKRSASQLFQPYRTQQEKHPRPKGLRRFSWQGIADEFQTMIIKQLLSSSDNQELLEIKSQIEELQNLLEES